MDKIQSERIIGFQSDVQIIYMSSINSLNNLVGEQNAIKRYVFCAMEKIAKLSIGIKPLLSSLSLQEEAEFSIGILLRSLLMDSILMLSVTQIAILTTEDNFEINRELAIEHCKRLLSDGTWNFIMEVNNNPNLGDADRKRIIDGFMQRFPDAIKVKGDKYILSEDYKVGVTKMYSSIDHPDLHMADEAYSLYNFYSKYDHLSHWTSASKNFSFERKLDRLQSSFLIMLFHLRDLLLVAIFFESSSELQPHYDYVHSYIASKIPNIP